MNNSEVEMFRSKDDPSQLWKREIGDIEYKQDWQVEFIHADYHHLMDEDRAIEIPEYAVIGRMVVDNQGTVKQAYVQNSNYDETKISSCELSVKKD